MKILRFTITYDDSRHVSVMIDDGTTHTIEHDAKTIDAITRIISYRLRQTEDELRIAANKFGQALRPALTDKDLDVIDDADE